jgi:glycine/D-amino acid oxidase-like deaminating enzyme/nitrite reductase/ring-hydroxylating ferredoxin subunit
MNKTILNLKETFEGPPISFWIASTEDTSYPALDSDLKVDAAVIGGGLVGITTAYLLKNEGLKVAVIDAGKIIKGTTGHTTAKITSQHGLIYSKIYQKMGMDMAKLYADANENAIHFISDLVHKKNIKCDLEYKSAYIYTQSDQYIKKIQDETKIASDLGIKASYIEEIPLPFKVKAAVKFEGQAQFHPRKYLLELVKDIEKAGCSIYESTRIMDIKHDDEGVTLITERGNHINAKYAVIASHYPCFDGGGMYFARMYPSMSYVVAAKISEKFPDGMFANAEEPGRSLRSQPIDDGEMILFSGEHHKTGQSDDTLVHYNNLRKFAMENYTVEKILYRWSTQDYETIDGVPYIGTLTSRTKNIFAATGFGKWGMTNSTISAIIIKDLIVSGSNPWEVVYTPSRFVPSSIGSLIKDNADVAKNLIQGKLETPENDADIKNGEAKVVDADGKKAGAYRDDNGNLHIVDNTCTHIGCELKWNSAERTWDCPCHGSRFNYDGEIVEGPAVHKLKHIDEGINEKDPNIFQ